MKLEKLIECRSQTRNLKVFLSFLSSKCVNFSIVGKEEEHYIQQQKSEKIS